MNKTAKGSKTIRANKRKAKLQAKHRPSGRGRLHNCPLAYFTAIGGPDRRYPSCSRYQ
jgi:hypothetical protein